MEYNQNGIKVITNCPDEDVRTIGIVGIDVIQIVGFHLPALFTEPVYDDPCMRPNATASLQELNIQQEYVACEQRKVKIDKTSTLGYKLAYGNTNTSSYAILEIHSNLGNGDNLASMSINDVYDKFNIAYQDLLENYEIELPFDDDSLRVKKAEITKTFPTEMEFADYDRILNTMSWALSTSRKNYTQQDSNMAANKWDGKKNTRETHVLLWGSTIKVTTYNKTKELMQKIKRRKLEFDSKLMRVEISAKEQNLCSMSSAKNKHTYLKDLTDDVINNYYTSYFETVFEKIDAYLSDQWNWNITGKNQDSTNNLSFLMDNAILPILQANAKLFIENLLQTYTLEERDHVLRLLDITDLVHCINKIPYFHNSHFISNVQSEINNMIANKNVLVMPYVGQRKLYTELRSKIMNPIEAHMYYVGNHILWLENPERNPVPSELLFLSNSDDDRIYETNTMPPIYFTEKIIHQRAGKTGRITSTEKNIHFLTHEEIDYAKRNAEQQLEAWIDAYENAHGDYDDGEDDNYYN